jgi:LacI family transcriptional regulator
LSRGFFELQRRLEVAVDRRSAVPLAVQIHDQLTWLIASRVLKSGDRLPSIRLFASELGIHHHTVRAVYRQLAGEGLIAVRAGSGATVLDFESLQLARPKVGGVVEAIAVLIAGYDPYYLPFLRGIDEIAQDMRALTIVGVTGDSPVRAQMQLDQLLARGCSGIIAASVGGFIDAQLQVQSASDPAPIVHCDQPDRRRNSIVFDGVSAAVQVAEHFASHGHTSIAFMAPSGDLPNMRVLLGGFERAVADGAIERVTPVAVDDFGVESATNAAVQLLREAKLPLAIATGGDATAIGVMIAARDLGLRVGRDVALISYGEIEAARHLAPPLSTVSTPAFEMGRRAAQELRSLMSGRPDFGVITLPTHLVVRESCGPHGSELN